MTLVAPTRWVAAWLAWIRTRCMRVISVIATSLGRAGRPTAPPGAERSCGPPYRTRMRSATDLLVIPVVTQAINRPHQYEEIMWAMERARGRAVLIDLAQVRVLKLSFFEALAAGWSSSWHVTKLGVRVPFEQWAGLHRAIEP